jgi:hypothetical protein
MRVIEEYFTHVYHLMQGLPHVHAERYEEQILAVTEVTSAYGCAFLTRPYWK